MVRAQLGWLLLVLCAALSAPCAAHQGGTTAYAAIDIAGNTLRYQLTLAQWPAAFLTPLGGDLAQAAATLPAALAAKLGVSNDGEACAVANARLEGQSGVKEGVSAVLEVVCRAPIARLGIVDNSFDVLGTDVHTLAKITWPEGGTQFAFSTDTRQIDLQIAASAAAPSDGFGSFFRLGLWHILEGYDHLMFLLALLLVPAAGWAVVRIVTAFTIAHSVTLALTALNLLNLPVLLVETAIAASIAFVAAQNLRGAEASAHRAWLTAAFGLVHGCGFADVLRETGLPTERLVSSLLGFNLGVEAGQLLVVLPLVPLIRCLRRRPRGRRVTQVLSIGLCAAGLGLVAVRLSSG